MEILREWSGSDRDHAFVASSRCHCRVPSRPCLRRNMGGRSSIYKVESSVQVQVSVRIIPRAFCGLPGLQYAYPQ
jgi:hypothetical protein